MNEDMIRQIFEVWIFPLLGTVLVPFIISWLKSKTQVLVQQFDNTTAEKYLNMLSDIVINCVIATNQTYVETLKQQGKFDAAAQKEAFTRTYTNIMEILSDEAKKILIEAVGDLELYVTELIEANVTKTKGSLK